MGSGYLWYLKSEHEARLRFEDQMEMALIEGEKASGTQMNSFLGNVLDEDSTIESIWDSKNYSDMRKKALEGNPCNLCLKNCTIYPSNY